MDTPACNENPPALPEEKQHIERTEWQQRLDREKQHQKHEAEQERKVQVEQQKQEAKKQRKAQLENEKRAAKDQADEQTRLAQLEKQQAEFTVQRPGHPPQSKPASTKPRHPRYRDKKLNTVECRISAKYNCVTNFAVAKSFLITMCLFKVIKL